jgi:hypothetical protein
MYKFERTASSARPPLRIWVFDEKNTILEGDYLLPRSPKFYATRNSAKTFAVEER